MTHPLTDEERDRAHSGGRYDARHDQLAALLRAYDLTEQALNELSAIVQPWQWRMIMLGLNDVISDICGEFVRLRDDGVKLEGE
jgi:hypothetical protein